MLPYAVNKILALLNDVVVALHKAAPEARDQRRSTRCGSPYAASSRLSGSSPIT